MLHDRVLHRDDHHDPPSCLPNFAQRHTIRVYLGRGMRRRSIKNHLLQLCCALDIAIEGVTWPAQRVLQLEVLSPSSERLVALSQQHRDDIIITIE